MKTKNKPAGLINWEKDTEKTILENQVLMDRILDLIEQEKLIISVPNNGTQTIVKAIDITANGDSIQILTEDIK